MAQRIPWGAMLRHAALLGIPPEAFWRLSLREWLWLARPNAPAKLDEAGLRALAARFPDEEKL